MIEGIHKSPSIKRDPALDWLRGVLVLFVLVLHAEIVSGIGRDSVVGYLNMSVGPVLMPAFFVLSGILGRKVLLGGWTDLLRGTLLRLLWPYFVWGLVYVLAVTTVEQKFDLNWQALTLLLTRPAMLGPIWYLAYLAAFFLLARFLRPIPPWAMMLVLAGMSMILSMLNGPLTDAVIHASAFFAGLAAASHGSLVARLFGSAMGRAALPLTICVLASTPYFVGDGLRDNGLFIFWILLASVVVVAGAQRLHTLFGSSFTTKLGAESLAFYLTHWPIMLIIRRANSELHLVDNEVAFWVALVLSLIGGALTVVAMRRAPIVRVLFEPPRRLLAWLLSITPVSTAPADLSGQSR